MQTAFYLRRRDRGHPGVRRLPAAGEAPRSPGPSSACPGRSTQPGQASFGSGYDISHPRRIVVAPSPCPAYTSAKAASCSGGASCFGGAPSPAGQRHDPTRNSRNFPKIPICPDVSQNSPLRKNGDSTSRRERPAPVAADGKCRQGVACRLKRVCERRSSQTGLGTRPLRRLHS